MTHSNTEMEAVLVSAIEELQAGQDAFVKCAYVLLQVASQLELDKDEVRRTLFSESWNFPAELKAAYQVLINMVQLGVIDGQGNFGDGDVESAAHPLFVECRVS